MKIVYSNQPFKQPVGPSIFLAGPTKRNSLKLTPWREQALQMLKDQGFGGTVLIPEPMSADYQQQIAWETAGLTTATVILFWIPRDLKTLPGFTTNIEFGEWMKSGKVVLGFPPTAPKMKYLAEKARLFSIPVEHSLSATISQVLELISSKV